MSKTVDILEYCSECPGCDLREPLYNRSSKRVYSPDNCYQARCINPEIVCLETIQSLLKRGLNVPFGKQPQLYKIAAASRYWDSKSNRLKGAISSYVLYNPDEFVTDKQWNESYLEATRKEKV